MNLDTALQIAATSHFGKKDKGGYSYILHPMRIAFRLKTNDEELMQIAILHDVIEDDPNVTFDSLKEKGFNERVISALKLLTHQRGQSYVDYVKGMFDNLDALLVKREDLRDNSDITRMKGLREKDVERMRKYMTVFKLIDDRIKELTR